jgi:U3 small nucleolar RNA-associated protein 3
VSEGEEREGEEEGDEGWWGSSKREYYDADNIETEADALVGCLPI